MDKKEDLPPKKPATRGGKAAGLSRTASAPEEIMKKMSSGNLSPLTQTTPGRLPSLRPERNLTLTEGTPTQTGVKNSLSGGASETGVKPKKSFAPNLSAGRRKPQQGSPVVVKEEFPKGDGGRGRGGRGRGRDGTVPTRGRGRGRPELIQVCLFRTNHYFFLFF